MKVTFAQICDYATVSREGKLSVMGIFSRIFAPQVPMVYPVMYLAFELELRAAELREKFALRLKLVDQDGDVIMQLDAESAVDATDALAGQTIRAPQVLTFTGLPLPKYGSYSLDIFLNNDHKLAVPFDVVLPPAGAGGGRPGLPK